MRRREVKLFGERRGFPTARVSEGGGSRGFSPARRCLLDCDFTTCDSELSRNRYLYLLKKKLACCALSAPHQLFLRSQRFELALDQSERRILFEPPACTVRNEARVLQCCTKGRV